MDSGAWFGVSSYAAAAIAYAGVTAMLVVSHPGGRHATWLATAAAVSSLWGVTQAYILAEVDPRFGVALALDGLHTLAWTLCVLSWLDSAPTFRTWPPRTAYAVLAVMLAGWAAFVSLRTSTASAVPATLFPALLGSALVGLLVVEQVFRNARETQKRSLIPFVLAIGGVFVIDLVAYAQATLLSGLVPFIWQSRGITNAALAPLLLLGLKRQSEWERALFVSRQVTFYTASLVAVGCYLLAMGVIAYLIRSTGEQWGPLLQIAFSMLAVIVLFGVLFSSSIRTRFRVFLVKNFYRHKYDYRQEWLRLTASLGQSSDLERLLACALAGVARIVESPRGSIWLTRDDRTYQRMETMGGEPIGESVYGHDHVVVGFLRSKGWVIDSEEYSREPDRYGTAFGAVEDRLLPSGSITIPLDCQGRLQGFVILLRPPHTKALNFEDHDILKTAGRQVAVVLAQAMAQEQLAETKQFEAVNRLTTFLMHDLKNLIAQQDLVVANAQRFRHRPEFFDDAINTVKSGVDRMRKVLDQLQQGGRKEPQWSRVDVAKALMEARSQCADRKPIPSVALPAEAVWVRIDRERLASVFIHLIRNAQDATPPDGRIDVLLARVGDDSVSITITDNGRGMDAAFVRDRLFRPFDSTKGAQGMGIGAYQARDIVRSAGGDVHVSSEPGAGTTFDVRLPVARVSRPEEPAA